MQLNPNGADSAGAGFGSSEENLAPEPGLIARLLTADPVKGMRGDSI